MIKKFFSQLKLQDGIVLAISTALLTWLSIGNMHWSIWFDEAFGAFLVRFNPAQIISYTAADVHPPFYYLVLKGWQTLFGSSEVALRSLSLACLVGAMIIGYFLLRKLFGRGAASLATLLLSFSPMMMRYSDEMRMYGLVVLIAVAATAVLVSAKEQSKRWKWVVYALLVTLGMWTHYFSAVVWIAHWVWHGIAVYRPRIGFLSWRRRMLSREWMWSYGLAVVLFLPWLPTAAVQFGGVQGGFWIGKVGAYSFTNFLTNLFFYREHHEVLSWLAVLFFAIIGLMIWLGIRVVREMKREERTNYLLLVCLTAVPPVALFMLSLPPLQSSFVERYMLTSFVASVWLIGVTLVLAWKQRPLRRWAVVGTLMVSLAFCIGVQYVFQIGNYNKNTNTVIRTKELMLEGIYAKQPTAPVLSQSPWLFYEAVYYEDSTRPVFFVDPVDYPFGSMAMLKDDTMHKVSDVAGWVKARPDFWYITMAKEADLKAPTDNLREVERVVLDNPNKGDKYIAVHYQLVQ